MSLKLTDVNIEITGKTILKNINLEIEPGDVVAILGPNGHGKSTLLKGIMHHYDTRISNGSILIDDILINSFSTDKIAQLGVYLAMQNPVEIPGLGMLELLRNEASYNDEKISVMQLYKLLNQKMKNLNMSAELLNRNINENFSGGERKKNEILQMQILDPKYILLDEIDSGLDVDAISCINNVLLEQKSLNKAIMYISHNDNLHKALQPNKVVVIMNGEIVAAGDYELAKYINQIGYQAYATQNGIELLNINEDEFLKQTNKGYNCGGIK